MRLYIFILLVALTASCKTSGDFASNIQKRKYTKGYYFDRSQLVDKNEQNIEIEGIVKSEIEKSKENKELISDLSNVPLLISADTLKKETEAEPAKTDDASDEYLIEKPQVKKTPNIDAYANPYSDGFSKRKLNPFGLIALGLLAISIFALWLAIAYSILFFLFVPLITGVGSLVLSIFSLSSSKYKDRSQYFGKGFSIAAFIGSIIFMVFYTFIFLIIFLLFSILGAI